MFRIWQRAAWGLLVLASSSVSYGQGYSSGGSWMSKLFEKSQVDFGVVAKGAETRIRVPIKNTYKETVHIAGVGASCGCIRPTLSSETLNSLDTAYLELNLDTIQHQGQKNVTVTVTFDAPVYEQVRIPVRAYIRTDVVVEPGSTQFGSVSKGSSSEKKLRIAYAGRDNWRITHVVSKNPNLVGKVEQTSRGGGHVEYELSVTLKPNAPVGDLREQIVLMTDDAGSPQVPIIVEARVDPEFVVSPEVVSFGVVAPGERKTINIVVRGRKPFQIQRVESEKLAGVFEVRLPPEQKSNKQIHVIPLTMIAPATQGNVDEKFTLTIKEIGETVHFRVLGKVVGQSVTQTPSLAN